MEASPCLFLSLPSGPCHYPMQRRTVSTVHQSGAVQVQPHTQNAQARDCPLSLHSLLYCPIMSYNAPHRNTERSDMPQDRQANGYGRYNKQISITLLVSWLDRGSDVPRASATSDITQRHMPPPQAQNAAGLYRAPGVTIGALLSG